MMKILAIFFSFLVAHTLAWRVDYQLPGEGWKRMPANQVPTESGFHSIGYRYADGTRTVDTWRYATTKKPPLVTQFVDSKNVKWKVSIAPNDDFTMVVPITGSLIFYGDERDRVGMDYKCRWAALKFWYQPSSWTNSHGIRLRTHGLVDSSDNYMSDLQNWSNILKIADQGVNLGHNIVDLALKARTGGRLPTGRNNPIMSALSTNKVNPSTNKVNPSTNNVNPSKNIKYTGSSPMVNDRVYYQLYSNKKDWHQAQTLCRKYSGRLASVLSLSEWEKIRKLTGARTGRRGLWVGGHDRGKEGRWQWDSGRPFSFTRWASSPARQPDNDGRGEDCLEIHWKGNRDRDWNDLPCSYKLPFICEWRLIGNGE